MRPVREKAALLVAVALVLAPAPPLHGQHRAATPAAALAPSSAASAMPRPYLLDSASARRSYWLEGGVLGGIVLGLGGVAVFGGLCAASECENSGRAQRFGGLLGAAVGFGAGALIGSAFHTRDGPPR